ncbi:MAG: phosphatidylserine decarboxylase family protein [Bacteroidota bacterium]
MRLHREGTRIIILSFLLLTGLCTLFYFILPAWFFRLLLLAAVIFFGLIVQFFRNPIRRISTLDSSIVYVPADGKVVVIEEATETEYFQEKRIQISIFMSPLNVHVNRYPIGGEIKYYQYHKGKYLVAWHPKSSTENERSTTVIQNEKAAILVRQIAGAVARRIKNYAQVGEQAQQGEEFGFIKFGSRVDVFLPLGTEIKVEIGQTVKGNLDVMAILG